MRLAALLVALALVGVGCGGDDEEPAGTTEPATTSTPAEPEGPGGRLGPGDGRGGVALEEIGTFDQPVYVAQPAGDTAHLYVVERCGRIVRVSADGGDAQTFLDVSGELTCEGTEQGLLSVAFHPNWDANGKLYAYFTDTEGDGRLVEYESTAGEPREALPDSARELLRVKDFAPNHNGGQLQFGPDRMLYYGTGDGGGAGDPARTAQDLNSPLGKIGRLDPRGKKPSELVAVGLRNPWRFSFDSTDGDLWIGDVGQDSLEEIDAAPAADVDRGGLNFGWSAYEGSEPYNSDQDAPGAIPPVHEYATHEGGTCSVTGGYVVRDPSLPSLFGRYLYGDYCTGVLRSFTAGDALERGKARDDRELGVEVPGLSSFGEDARGRVYAVSLDGPVYRLVPE